MPSRAPAGLRLYGAHAVAAALANPSRRCHRLIATEEGATLLTERSVRRNIAEMPVVARGQLDGDADRLTGATSSALLPEGAVHQGLALLADGALLPAQSIQRSACRKLV